MPKVERLCIFCSESEVGLGCVGSGIAVEFVEVSLQASLHENRAVFA